MGNRVTFPDFSAFQIDIPHGPLPHETSWAGDRPSDADLYAAFWPEYNARNDAEATAIPHAEEGAGGQGK